MFSQIIAGPGYCECGCGQATSVAARTYTRNGYTLHKGEHFRFVSGHRAHTGPIAFWALVPSQLGPDACWEWQGWREANGYGRFGQRKPHRLMYEAIHGSIPSGLFVCHRCDNPPCVNPAHLFVGSRQDNSDDMVAKGRASRTPYRGHKIDMDTARQIRSEFADGIARDELAERFGLKRGHVNKIIRGTAWKESAA